MKLVEQERIFPFSVSKIWEIISDLSRCDWVPGVKKITLENDTRIFQMDGMGDLVEKIIKCDEESKELHYSAIKTLAPINHHLAKIKLKEIDGETKFLWTTEIDPAIYADAIEKGMTDSLDQLSTVLSTNP